MSWKKNAISYMMWFLYVLLTEALMLICADSLGRKAGLSVTVSALLAFAYVALVGVIVLFIRFAVKKCASVGESKKVIGLVAEAMLCMGLLAVGVWLRVSNLDGMTQSAAYFETAQVTYGQSIPQVVHGAVYLYLQVLHGLFVLVGNHFVAGIWLQIVLQMLAFMVLFFVVRKMAGAVAALIVLAFGMCSPMMVQYALTLSPEMLYFLLMVLVLVIFMCGCGRKLHPAFCLLFGALAGVMTYLDIAGVFLILFAVTIPFICREEPYGFGRKVAALGCTMFSYVGVFAGTIYLDAFLSGKNFTNVLNAWSELYYFRSYESQGSITVFAIEEILLIGMLAIGIFSFWCHKRNEIISVGMLSVIGLIFLCMRFTEEMNGDLYCYLILVIMAGSFAGQVFSYTPVIAVEREDLEAFAGEDVMPKESAVISATEEALRAQEQKETDMPGAGDEQSENKVRPAVQLIENPLPLPKKHEKRVLDYAIELTEETADFDFDVADDDDFDK